MLARVGGGHRSEGGVGEAQASRMPLLNHLGSVQRKWGLRRYQGSLAIKSCNDINRQMGRASDKSIVKERKKERVTFFFFQRFEYTEFNRGQKVKGRRHTKAEMYVCVCVCVRVNSQHE